MQLWVMKQNLWRKMLFSIEEDAIWEELADQIETLKEQIKEAKRQRQAIEKQLLSQLDVALESYYGSEKAYNVIFDMKLNLESLFSDIDPIIIKLLDYFCLALNLGFFLFII